MLVATLSAFNGCDQFNSDPSLVKSTLNDRSTLRVATFPSTQTHIRLISGDKQGLETDLLRHFAKAGDLKISWIVKQNAAEALKEVEEGRADIAAIRATSVPNSNLRGSPVYQEQNGRHYRFLYRPQDHDLDQALIIWHQIMARKGLFQKTQTLYDKPTSAMSRADLERLKTLSNSRLPFYKSLFHDVGRENRISPALVAAVSYQESQWDPNATSFTGVKGLMMLTRDTAEHLGIADRTDPEQSVWAGVSYLKRLYSKTPAHLGSRERWFLALAAYNVGWGHLQDAQKIAIELNLNPESWHDLREVLPLLASPKWSDFLTYGPARGHEPVQFAERVMGFFDSIR